MDLYTNIFKNKIMRNAFIFSFCLITNILFSASEKGINTISSSQIAIARKCLSSSVKLLDSSNGHSHELMRR